MRLREWKDSKGNKVSATSVVNTTSTSSGSFKKKFEKLLAYAQAHKNASVSTTTVNSVSDNEFSYSEKIRGGYSSYDREITVYIGSQTEAWRLKIYIDNKIDEDLAGQGWPELLKTLRYYITVPVVTTLDYKNLLTEWLDAKGKKVSINNSLSLASNKTSSKTNKEKFEELTDYMATHKSSLATKAEVVRLDDGGFTYKEYWKSTMGQDYMLTLLVGYSRFNSSWRFELYMDTAIINEVQGSGWEELLEKLEKYFHVPKAGSKEYKSLCEVLSIADDFKLYENLWN